MSTMMVDPARGQSIVLEDAQFTHGDFEHDLKTALGQGRAQPIRAFRDWAREQDKTEGPADERG